MKKLSLLILAATGLAMAAPIAAPDTADITGSIANMVGAGVAVVVAFLSAKWGIRALRSLLG